MDRKITVKVPVVTKGKCIGVEPGGILQLVRREMDVLCLPGQIPENFEIDITDLEIGDSVHVEDIPLDEDIEVPHDVNFTVLTISSPKIEEEEVVEEEEEEEATDEEAAEKDAEDESGSESSE